LVNVADEFFLAKLLCRKGDAERTMAPWFIWLPKGRNTSALQGSRQQTKLRFSSLSGE
jgi:hypothetical protein